jgi:hypothetical protein
MLLIVKYLVKFTYTICEFLELEIKVAFVILHNITNLEI